jgi:hypothetical protein
MDLINGTVTTAIIGGLIILAFVLGPRLAAGSLVEENLSLKAERATQALRRRLKLYAELRAFASGGALVLAGLILAAIYCFAAHRLPA